MTIAELTLPFKRNQGAVVSLLVLLSEVVPSRFLFLDLFFTIKNIR